MGNFSDLADGNEEMIKPERWSVLKFYIGDGEDGVLSARIAPGVPFRLKSVRIHCSKAFPSAEYLIVKVSSIKDSAYDQLMMSKAMTGVLDFSDYYYNNEANYQLSDDAILVTLSMKSGAVVTGIEITTWAAIG